MTWVKICGITNLEDALVAVDAGADAVGFVFYEKSPRHVTVEVAREICKKLPESVEKVGVFVGGTAEDASSVFHRVRLTTVQVYTGQTAEWLAWYQTEDIKLMFALPGDALKGEFFIQFGTTTKPITALLVDSGSATVPGGTGECFDWEGAKIGIWHLKTEVPVVVAGGLTPDNVAEAIMTLHPWGVDVASGVEARPGKKDPEKVRAFVRTVREADRKTG
ncbi:MAG TPA: phosphoribosylanthranilate isomerase [Verrucomicrobiae bacterium]|jgi:phosphoribosylanthranilate isomerase|nr:phosphoribosylanthranilate isomerase [Verrucomicrobiae bacterium]